MIRAISVVHSHDEPTDTITLTFADRFRRRIAMESDNGIGFLLDLTEATELTDGECLLLEDGRFIRVLAANERLMRVFAQEHSHLARVAWHIGNRHLPCEIQAGKIVLAYDHVIFDMLRKLDCRVEEFDGPFNPEGGAYGQGRTHGHSH